MNYANINDAQIINKFTLYKSMNIKPHWIF